MLGARRSVTRIAAVWLLCQGVALAAVPALLDEGLDACICTHSADTSCPMHHKSAAASRVCVVQSATANVPAALNLVFSVAGLVPALQLDVPPVQTVDTIVVEHSVLRYRSSPPASPPPRA